jgi:hypothetical protein
MSAAPREGDADLTAAMAQLVEAQLVPLREKIEALETDLQELRGEPDHAPVGVAAAARIAGVSPDTIYGTRSATAAGRSTRPSRSRNGDSTRSGSGRREAPPRRRPGSRHAGHGGRRWSCCQ